MSPAQCARSFEVEAMRDGRLGGAELASFARHLTSCAACAHEARALEALAEAVRAASGAADDIDRDELRVLRARTRLIAAFDRGLVASAPKQSARRWLRPAVVAAAFAGMVILGRARLRAPAVRAASVVVQAERATVWAEHAEGERKRLVLSRGAIWVHVDHRSGSGRVVVELPDGELEDRGTTFTVSVQDGHTSRVAVDEGSVVLRLKGERSVTIDAGDTWAPEPRVASPESRRAPALAPGAVPVPAPVLAPVVAPAPARRTPARPRVASSPRPVAVAAPAALDPAHDFRAAVALFDAGANSQAAAAFATFAQAHPRDPRAEDAAYLLVIALQRSGAEDDMKRAAQQYLRRYPAGFRRSEVETLERRP